MTKHVLVLFDVEDKIATIALNQPERKNALDAENGSKIKSF